MRPLHLRRHSLSPPGRPSDAQCHSLQRRRPAQRRSVSLTAAETTSPATLSVTHYSGDNRRSVSLTAAETTGATAYVHRVGPATLNVAQWSYTGSPPPFRSWCEAWKLSATCRSVLLHMQSLPVSPYRYKILHRFASKYTRTPARRERVGWTRVCWGICHMVAWSAGGCHMGCICVQG